jgi:hypothetical protein
MRPMFVVLLIFGMVAMSGAAFADSVRILDISPGRSMAYSERIGSGYSELVGSDPHYSFQCCGGAESANELRVTFSADFEDFSSALRKDCTASGQGTQTLIVVCTAGIEKDTRIRFDVTLPQGATLVSAYWCVPAGNGHGTGEACLPASPVPEPQTLVLVVSALLSFPLGARVIHRKQRT